MDDMPNYGNPPVSEVAIGFQYTDLDLAAAQVGLYWSYIREHFPGLSQHPPIMHIVEPDVIQAGPPIRVHLQFRESPGFPRTWFVSAHGDRLIQLQPDRFLHNWRKVEPGDAYPRFPCVRDEFFKQWERFCTFLQEQSMPAPQIDQCELTYVNTMAQGTEWKTIADLATLVLPCPWDTRERFLPLPETFAWSAKFRLPESKGRLHVDLSVPPLDSKQDEPIRLALTARGIPSVVDDQHLREWFEMARIWIVKGFEDIVHPHTDTLWGKIK